ncbi:hypothetical protein SAMN02745751_01521 [Dethiosulfatibacter aminovorans DSM 17477]|uniref:Uncharacterized protein n=1 Tax=Dethiosulfatibacter aminovorans DSM 17477 TaxID=1121476 RepID=A0A1M6FSB1_9FIRM|nr:hypothetical protein [Dethiosulfatibacter aminovorans]SHJ00584.1 hypothetical protein SAMN02745751_01521 [Dethiosulfatibacter aminovorans DSM 17477]
MDRKVIVLILLPVLIGSIISGCSIFAKNDILSTIKDIEKSDEMFTSFQISYDDYLNNINEYLTDNYKKNNLEDTPFIQTSDTTINYSSLSGKSAGEIQMLVGKVYYVSDKFTVSEHVMSDIYYTDDKNICYVYVMKVKIPESSDADSVKDQIVLFKKYKIIKANRNWYVDNVETKYADYSSNESPEESGFIDSKNESIKYQYTIE